MTKPFWKIKPLEALSRNEWESLCDGCARCCLLKLEDEETGEVHTTDVVCQLLDLDLCRCTDYPNRQKRVPTCFVLTPENLGEIAYWMPPTCAYRLLHEGNDLPSWHPLVSGVPQSVVEAGISVRGRVMSEAQIDEDELPLRLVEWPEGSG